ncbi:MAG: L,D-transpeptidase family protein [Chromatiales bacterium]|nr:L,D-transpeptidase family protein [Chromatiales bacterium]
MRSAFSRTAGLFPALLLAACAPVDLTHGPVSPVFTIVPAAEPVVEHRFLVPESGNVVGELQVIQARHADTFVDIARAYGLGYDELVNANPGVDPWLPGEGTRILLPTRFVLPDAPRNGIVLNLATRRLFWYPEPSGGEPAVVYSFPIGIGREGWETPLGTTRVIARHQDPTWVVPASIRRERAAQGDPLPARVPPGPDNPLGRHALRLALPSYLIHGTNRPAGIGMRVSHGCIQMFPEDIELLHGVVPLNTPVHIVDQPLLDPPPWPDEVVARARPVRNIVIHSGEAPRASRLQTTAE